MAALPVVRRRYRLTVPERITKDGSVLVPLDEDEGARAGAQAEGGGRRGRRRLLPVLVPQPGARARVAEIVREEFPEAFLSVSSEVLPQYREYERFSTVCLNAYVGPKVATLRQPARGRAARRWASHRRPPDDLGERRRHRGGRPSRGRSTCSCPARSRASSAASGPASKPASTT